MKITAILSTRTLWLIYLGLTGLFAVLGFVVPYKGHFGIDSVPLFGVWFGAIAVGAIFVVAKIYGGLTRREDHYYD